MPAQRWSEWTTITSLDDGDFIPVLDGTSNRKIAVSNAAIRLSRPVQQAWGPSSFNQLAGATLGPAPATRAVGWLFDGTTEESIMGWLNIPEGWLTVSYEVAWANAGAGTGDVRWELQVGAVPDATDLALAPSQTVPALVDTAGAQWIVQRMSSEIVSVPIGPIRVVLKRLPAHATDTLANDAAFYQLIVRRIT